MHHPRLIHHPRSTKLSPPDHIDQYLTYWLRKPLDKEVRNKLRAECPRPTIAHKATNTPEFDSYMSTYMAKRGRDPRKGIKKDLKSTHDK